MNSFPRGFRLLAGALAFVAVSCTSPAPLRVGAKNTSEQHIVGEIIAQHLEAKLGRAVERQFGLAGSVIAHESLISGQADLYVEDPVSAITEVLRQELATDPEANLNICRIQYSQMFQAEWLNPLGYTRKTVIAVRKDLAAELKITSLSGLVSAVDRGIKMAAVRDFSTRADGFGALQASYNLHLKDGPRFGLSAKELFQWLDQKQVDFVATDSTSGFLSAGQYVVLEDDKLTFPPSAPNIVTRKDALAQNPGLLEALKPLAGKFDQAAIQRLTAEVDLKGRSAAGVAKEWLASHKL
jgi:glycine betaine/choline ABC-type transport system substrate-binding protein